MTKASSKKATHSRARSIAFCGLCIALVTVSAWVSVPIGPVPITLQVFALAFVALILPPKEACATIVIYLVLGAVGLPVFSSMRGGIGILIGPTGGFLWGYIFGILGALLVRHFLCPRPRSSDFSREEKGLSFRQTGSDALAVGVFLLIAYVCGWMQFMFVMGVGPGPAFLTAIAPFIIFDIFKLIAAVITAGALRRALKL